VVGVGLRDVVVVIVVVVDESVVVVVVVVTSTHAMIPTVTYKLNIEE
jgi:hypothetical protein